MEGPTLSPRVLAKGSTTATRSPKPPKLRERRKCHEAHVKLSDCRHPWHRRGQPSICHSQMRFAFPGPIPNQFWCLPGLVAAPRQILDRVQSGVSRTMCGCSETDPAPLAIVQEQPKKMTRHGYLAKMAESLRLKPPSSAAVFRRPQKYPTQQPHRKPTLTITIEGGTQHRVATTDGPLRGLDGNLSSKTSSQKADTDPIAIESAAVPRSLRSNPPTR